VGLTGGAACPHQDSLAQQRSFPAEWVIMKGMQVSLFIAISCGLISMGCGGVDSTEVLDSTNDGFEGAPLTSNDTQDELTDEAFRVWSPYTSEEFLPAECASNRLVDGVDCEGSYCDLVSLDCETVNNFAFGESTFAPTISEETSGGSTGGGDYICDSDEWVTGIRCTGGYCDNVSIECTVVSNRGKRFCGWTTWISEETSSASTPALGYWIDGVDCKGSYCDQMRFHYCQPYIP
jgi:hypothetical protein